ncbi:MAG: hypothetical protein D8M57_17715 [Candidatus Scalindua sp. AMX11]|nr:MAG: hypothetical protein DWQ00_06500 [Candidatus Scalindua sp.]NOG85210.1 hypothetical protein [Planctomycetota bacterium]RZV66143.1 MAG: hypothetical protein EX341_17605 [Candidatus Scalindua sp. SCAELEC01]TDE63548.1 MAG: hypothetical protein D8M57_17715 [Candidatus Scalindua sp. AMX11]
MQDCSNQKTSGGALTIVDSFLRVQEKVTCCFIALSFRSDLVDLIEQDRRRSLSYSEDTASEEAEGGLKMRCPPGLPAIRTGKNDKLY